MPTVTDTGLAPRHVDFRPFVLTGSNRVFAAALRIGGSVSLIPSYYGAAAVRGTRGFPNWTPVISITGRPAPPSEPVRVGFLGRISPMKGVATLAQAVRELAGNPSAGGSLELWLAGDHGHIPEDEVAVVERAIGRVPAELVVRCGRVVPERFLEQVDLLVVASECSEVFGLTAAEAMSAGVPLISASMWFIIFMASTMHRMSPFFTVWPISAKLPEVGEAAR